MAIVRGGIFAVLLEDLDLPPSPPTPGERLEEIDGGIKRNWIEKEVGGGGGGGGVRRNAKNRHRQTYRRQKTTWWYSRSHRKTEEAQNPSSFRTVTLIPLTTLFPFPINGLTAIWLGGPIAITINVSVRCKRLYIRRDTEEKTMLLSSCHEC